MGIPFARNLLARFSPRRRMRADWDLRARRNARYYIDCGHGESEESFWKSGEEDIARSILRDIRISRDAVAIEIGCGIGRLLAPLASRVGHVVGVDISPEMITRGREALSSRDNVRLEVTEGDLACVESASADFVFSFIVFQHIPSPAAISQYFREASRVLAGGGVLRFQADGRPEHARVRNTWNGMRYRGEELRAELDGLRFDTAEITGEGTQYMWVTAIRRREADRGNTAAVSFTARAWDPAAVRALVGRLGGEPETDSARLISGALTPRALAEGLLVRGSELGPREYVAEAYRAILGREPDEAGLSFYASEIEQGIHRTNVVDCLISSEEFADRHRAARAGGASPAGATSAAP